MAKTHWLVMPGCLVPLGTVEEHWLSKYKLKTVIEAETKQPRDHKRLREAFGLLNLVFPHQDQYKDIEGLRDFVTREAGFVETFGLQGTQYYIERARSWSFNNMEDPDFNRLLDRMKDVILEHFWPNMTKDEFNLHYADAVLNWCGAGGLSEIDRMPG